MARSERQEDGTRSGVGTLTRSGTRPRPQQAPETEPGAPDPRRGRPARQVPSPRPAAASPAAAAPRPDASGRAADRRDQRVPSQRSVTQRAASEQRASAGRRPGAERGEAPQAVAAPPRPGLRRKGGVPPEATPARRATGPQRARATGPQPAVAPAQPAQAPRAEALLPKAGAPSGSHRMPFVLLLCGLLGGALVSALVISTTLAEGSFQISKLQDSTSSLAKQQQSLEEQVAQAQSPQQIAQRATQLGMRRVSELQFIDLTTGKTTNDGPTWSGALNAPGYAP